MMLRLLDYYLSLVISKILWFFVYIFKKYRIQFFYFPDPFDWKFYKKLSSQKSETGCKRRIIWYVITCFNFIKTQESSVFLIITVFVNFFNLSKGLLGFKKILIYFCLAKQWKFCKNWRALSKKFPIVKLIPDRCMPLNQRFPYYIPTPFSVRRRCFKKILTNIRKKWPKNTIKINFSKNFGFNFFPDAPRKSSRKRVLEGQIFLTP